MEPSEITKIVAINGLYQQQAPAQISAKQPRKDSPQVANETSSAAVDTVRTSATMKNFDTVRTIGQLHVHLNQLAQNMRETTESVYEATYKVDAMKSHLEVILKNFPPFMTDNKERNDRLMEYTSLRKELLSLMVPPPPPAPYEKVKYLWDALFDKNGKLLPLLIPQPENNSSDAELKNATQTLDLTLIQLTDLSSKVNQTLVQP